MQTNLSEIITLAEMLNKGKRSDEPRWRRDRKMRYETIEDWVKAQKEQISSIEKLFKKEDKNDKKGSTLSLVEAATFTTMLCIASSQIFVWYLLLHH